MAEHTVFECDQCGERSMDTTLWSHIDGVRVPAPRSNGGMFKTLIMDRDFCSVECMIRYIKDRHVR